MYYVMLFLRFPHLLSIDLPCPVLHLRIFSFTIVSNLTAHPCRLARLISPRSLRAEVIRMSVEDVTVVHTITSSLRAALDKASTIRTTDTIEPPLPAASFESDLSNLKKLFETPNDDTSKSSSNAVFEYAARAIFYPLVAADLNEGSFTAICNFFDLLQLCAGYGLCETTLPLLLVEELLDGQSTLR